MRNRALLRTCAYDHSFKSRTRLGGFRRSHLSLLIGTYGCSPKGDPTLYGKWKSEKTTVNFANGTHDEQPGGKVIEFRKDGTYIEGEKNGRAGKYEVVDPQHLRIQIDGLAGEPKIVLQGDTLDICNPDGTTIEHYRRLQ